MKNPNNDGIYCDYCGKMTNGDFTYYSFDFYKVIRVNNRSRIDETVALSADLCEQCMELFRGRLRQVAASNCNFAVRCDVTGEDLSHSEYYICKVACVVVNMTNQPYECAGCHAKRNPEDGPCPCFDGTKLVRIATVDVDDKYVELNFSLNIYNRFVDQLNRIHDIGEIEWTK